MIPIHMDARGTSLEAEIDAVVQAELEAQQIVGLGLGVVVEGDVYYLQGYGLEDREHDLPVSPASSLFRWASVSKTLTAVAAMTLVEDGALELDADIRAYYPSYDLPRQYLTDQVAPLAVSLEPLPDGVYITLRQLMGHLAGIQHYDNGLAKVTPPVLRRNDPEVNSGFEWAFPRWVGAPLVYLPGETYSYSSPGFNLAGAVVGAVYAARYDLDVPADDAYTELVETDIAQAAGADGLQPDYQWADLEHRAVGYVILPNGSVVRDTDTDVSWKLPSGGFVSTAADAAAYCAALADGTLLGPEALETMWTTQRDADGSATGYGLGFGVGSRNGRKRVAHNGEQEKASSRLVLYPDDGLCIVLLTNTHADSDDDAPDLGRIADEIEDVVRQEEGL